MDIRYLKGVMKYLLSACISIVLIVYIVYHLAGGFETELETTPAPLVTTQSTITSRITILRSERVLYAPFDGDISYLYADGDKVSINTTVAEIYPQSGADEIRQLIIELDRKIRLLESSNMSDTEKRTDTASTDNLIRKHLYDILNAVDKGKIASADAVSDDFLIQLNRRRIITKTVNHYNVKIEALRAEKEALSATLVGAEGTVVTDRPGYFYTSLDGYENIFNAENISSLTYREYLEMTKKDPDSLQASQEGYPVGKLVTDYVWYVACEIDISELHNYETGKRYSIKFPYNNGSVLSMNLYRILSEVGSDTAVLIFSADILPEDFSYLRYQTVQIVRDSYTGYRVPVSAVRIVNGQPGVYILRGSQVIFRYIIPLYEYDGYLIVAERDKNIENYYEYLAKNEFVITKGKELYDGKIVG